MSWEYVHLVTHPFPVVLAVTGLVVGAAGWIVGRERLERWGLLAVLLAGVATPVAYYSGIAAADTVGTRTFVEPSLVQTHRSWATWAAIVLVTTGVFAGFALWQDRGRPEDRRLRRFVFLVGAGAVALLAYAAWLGGGIIHRDAGPDPSVDASAETAARRGNARYSDPHTLETPPWHAPPGPSASTPSPPSPSS